MENLADIEFCIISCVMLKPDLMNNLKIKSEHMKDHKTIWNFLKEFYKKFGDFDIQLMYSMYPNTREFQELINLMAETFVTLAHFDLYQEELIRKREQSLKDKIIIEKVSELSSQLQCNEITTGEFKQKIDKIYNDIDKIYLNGTKINEIN